MEPLEAAAPATNGLKKRKVPDSDLVRSTDGFKLRGMCVPWRPAAGQTSTGQMEVLLIEGLNSPGLWSFPGGSLDPGEDVATCAQRETQEESGANGTLGCFLGLFEVGGSFRCTSAHCRDMFCAEGAMNTHDISSAVRVVGPWPDRYRLCWMC